MPLFGVDAILDETGKILVDVHGFLPV